MGRDEYLIERQTMLMLGLVKSSGEIHTVTTGTGSPSKTKTRSPQSPLLSKSYLQSTTMCLEEMIFKSSSVALGQSGCLIPLIEPIPKLKVNTCGRP